MLIADATSRPKPMEMYENYEIEEQHENRSHHGHGLLMVVCCGVPLVLIVVLSILGIVGSWGYYALILLCPIIHFLLIRGMGAKHKG